MSLVKDWADFMMSDFIMSDYGFDELREFIDGIDGEAREYALIPDDGDIDSDLLEELEAAFNTGVYWARYRAEHERAGGVEKMLKGVKGL